MSRPTDWWILDRDNDPTPGDVARLRGLARSVRTIADDADVAARHVRNLAKDHEAMGWIGAAGDAFKEAVGEFPGQLAKVGDSHGQAADALDAYIRTLDTAQAQADRALASGREVYDQVKSLRSQLATARGSVDALNVGATDKAPEPPDEEKVKAATRRHTAAKDRVESLSGQLGGPEAQLEAAKKLAGQAAGLRNTAADTADQKIRDAADAGIPPDSFWDKVKDIAGKVWEGIIVVAKIVVAVGGIIALIIGGPIAWIVLAAALLVLVDTLMKYADGEASLWDVGMALVSCIPMTKGLTSLTALKGAFASKGMLGVGGHLLSAGGGALKGMGAGAMALWKGRSALPGLVRALPFTAWGKLSSMATNLRYGTPGALTGFGAGFGDGAGLFGSFRSGFGEASAGWHAGTDAASSIPSQAARGWQGSGGYPGIDLWSDTVVPAGTQLEALHPRLTGFAMPEGTMAAAGGDSAAVSRGVQVGPSDLNPYIHHEYRTEGVRLQFNNDVPAAGSHAIANPQFGEGGLPQYFVPDVMKHVDAGNISVVDGAGNVLPVAPNGIATVGPGQSIPLHNFDLAPGSPILTNGDTAATAAGGTTIVGGIRTGAVGTANTTAPSR